MDVLNSIVKAIGSIYPVVRDINTVIGKILTFCGYYLVVYYSQEYANNLEYIGLIDNIEIKINSNQIVE